MKKNSNLLSKIYQKFSSLVSLSVASICLLWTQVSHAAEPTPWQWYFQSPATPVMEQIIEFHNLMFFVEVGIVLLVLGLMVYIVVKFNSKANPEPTKTTHNTALEVLWTVIPIVILIVFAVPSMKLLFFMEKAQNPEMTLKVTGNQWYWSYQYPDNGNFEFDSNIIPDEDIKPGQRRLLEVDNQVVLPVNTEIKVLLTARDVMHNWAVPAFGIKMDTIPGRINETWVKVTKIGTYYGQCSELCGVAHSRMPIAVKVVSKEDFKKWLKKAKSEFASSDDNEVLKLAQFKKSK
ncbi:MAG: cytochrome c oxidase subunit II [Rhodospirillaceae bacterium]|nr:cytochrome c oxidase subunit II [Rhodospirillaceae bacterium]OUT80715.1 MAG: cytochrome c oxidase subunit II [Rhodospirillaceae bacterium TMED23]|tara:strand:- start:403 stop:1275 length:873 start_codon:yes stop_codon:yes gene_type:complete